MFIPESKKLNDLLRDFRSRRNHLAIVVDEFGRTAGLVTIEDVLEEIVGEIEDEFDIDENDGAIYAMADGKSWRVAGNTEVERVAEHFELNLQADGDAQRFDTIAGLIAHELGHVPKRGGVMKKRGCALPPCTPSAARSNGSKSHGFKRFSSSPQPLPPSHATSTNSTKLRTGTLGL